MPHLAIVGPGAIGSVVAAWLGQTERHSLTLCARRPLGGELRVETPQGTLALHPNVITDPAQATHADWVLVTTKAYDSAAAAKWLPGFGADTPVAVLQNGVEHYERFESFLPRERIVPVMVDIPSERTSPNFVRQRGHGKMVVPDTKHGREFAALFAGTALDVSLTTDFKSTVWRKLCLNNAGVISALLLQPAGVMRDEQIGELARQLVRECIAVGRAEGAVLDDSLADTIVEAYRKAPPDSVNSLHADRAAGRPMELDARNGIIVRLGRKHGIPTPCNQMAVALLEAMDRASRPE